MSRQPKVCVSQRHSILNNPEKSGSFSDQRPSNDLFALTERIGMRADFITVEFDTPRIACTDMVRLCAIYLLIAICLGCGKSGPRRAAASGHVTLDGQPIDEGVIQFLPVQGTVGPETGGVIANGQYAIAQQRGPVVGMNRIELRASKKTGRKIQDPTGRPGVLTDEYKEMFPTSSNTNSTLVREIKDDPNTLDFDIRTK
jgi:hypothetical protein